MSQLTPLKRNAKVQQPDMPTAVKITGLYIAYSTDADEFNRICKFIFDKNEEIEKNKMSTENKMYPVEPTKWLYINVGTEKEPDYCVALSQYFMGFDINGTMKEVIILPDKIRDFNFICTNDVDDFNNKASKAIADGYLLADDGKVTVLGGKVFFTAMFIKSDEQLIQVASLIN